MSDLHEIYAKLLKRGMPERPFLHRPNQLENKWTVRVRFQGREVHSLIREDEARDLIAMHALRNLDSIIHKARVAQRWQEGWNLFLDEDYWSGRCTVFKFTAQTILETISAAITHLEGA